MTPTSWWCCHGNPSHFCSYIFNVSEGGCGESRPWAFSAITFVVTVAVPVSEPHFLDLTFQDSPYSMKTTYLKIQVSGVAQGGAYSPFRGIFVDGNSVVGTCRAQKAQVVSASDFS